MPLVPLQIPPGISRKGTALESTGRWFDGSLIRWKDGVLQPIGGWAQRGAATATGVARKAMSWRANNGNRWLAFGTHDALKVMSAANVVTDITPTGLTAGVVSASANTGYGGGFYGDSFYGTARPEGETIIPATTWALDNWGEYLVACSSADGKIYEWQLNIAVDAAIVTNAPTGNNAILVTEERFLLALGAGGNPRKVQWSDRESNTVWTPSTTNEAGDIELQTSGQIMLGLRTRGQSLILTDLDAHTVTYQGPPYVYGFERVGSSCGAASRNCAAAVDAGVFWMSRDGFYSFSSGGVLPLPSEVSDYVFNNINIAQISKVSCVANGLQNEVWWFYPSSTSTENDRYVAFNYAENYWAIGEMARTCGVDAGVFRNPILIAPTGPIYAHETGWNYGGAEVYVESGPVQIGVGDQTMMARELIPDEKTQGDVTTTFKTRFYPNDTERSYGPYSMSAPTSVRFSGRQVVMRVTGARLADWRWGIPRIEVQAGGNR
jgi:hypothetical protein